MSSTLLEHLNPPQLEAVTLPFESALILAGAGSGKTRVLTTRIAHLIQTGQVSPHGLLAVTFTNKASKEMLTRISAMLPINTRGMWVGTFHGLCNRLLRAHHKEAGLPALRHQAPAEIAKRRRREVSAQAVAIFHQRQQGSRRARQGCGRLRRLHAAHDGVLRGLR
jgi:superfamily I DNA/RNA helicase